MREVRLFAIALVLSLGAAPRAHAQAPDTSLWVANGPINASVRVGNTLYVGGAFSRVGPNIGAGVPFDAGTGQPVQPFARVPGTVNAVVSDGAGGWFVGGRFMGVAGTPRRNLVHLLSNGSVSAWAPDPDSEVLALALSGSTLYVGGKFEHVGGQPRFKIGAVNMSSGLATAFDPNPPMILSNVWPFVRTLAVAPGAVYAGGYFFSIGGQPRKFCAALDPVTGAATAWDAHSDGFVLAIAPAGGTVYVGGSFVNIGGSGRIGLAELSASTGTAAAWNPHPEGSIYCLALSATQLYVGGTFTNIGVVSRNGAAGFDRATGALTAFDPQSHQDFTSVPGPLHGLAVQSSTVYAAGEFTSIGGRPRRYLAALDATTGLASAWDTDVNTIALAVAADGGTVFAGGNFWTAGGLPRFKLAAFDLATGRPTNWAPTIATGTVLAMVTDGVSIYLGGYFFEVNGETRTYLAKLDVATGALAAWDPSPNSYVTCLALAGSTLYVGGYFDSVDGGGSPTLAALDAATGLALPWLPATSGGPVNKIAPDPANNAVTVASQGGFWRFRASDGATLWSKIDNCASYTLVQLGSTVYVGGCFTSFDGQPRSRLAAMDAATGALLPWAPNANGYVTELITDGSRIYAGGAFTTMGGQARSGLAVLDAASGVPDSFNAGLDARVVSVTLGGADLFLNGGFTSCENIAAPGFVRIGAPAPLAVEPPVSRPLALRLEAGPVPSVGSTILRWSLPTGGRVWLDVLDVQGRRVVLLLGGEALPAGVGARSLDTHGWSPGLYLARLRTSRGVALRRIVVQR